MDWKLLASTFTLVFFAELGDKTQLATMMLAAQSGSPSSVFIGASLALVLTSFLGVLFGEAVVHLLPQRYITTGSGVAFIVLGLLLVLGKF
ncbi:MAG: TMEM165/GDT1 family protein [Firmicutes bacterium]|nr:TMEM165/GDT1 family protein [Bacillota bacterium]